VAGLYAAGLLALLAGGILATAGGLAADLSSTLTAAFFLLAPVSLLRFRGIDPPVFLGLHAHRLGRSLLACLSVAAVVFPLYVLAFQGWATFVEDRPMRLPEHPFEDHASDVRGRPDLAGIPDCVLAWTQQDVLYVLNASGREVQARVEGCVGPVSGLARRDGRLFLRESAPPVAEGSAASGSIAPDAGWRCPIGPSFHVRLEGDHAPWRTGEHLSTPDGDTVASRRTPWWLLELLLVHLLVVALPEETFYRGYVQARLAPLFRRRIRVLGADLGAPVVVASALFALSHLVAIPAPFRLAVFFPGLLFGWLRERTGSLVAPVVLHALSNVLLAVLVRFQGGG